MSTTIVARRSRNWGCVVRMKTETWRRIECFGRRGRALRSWSFTVTIKFKPERFAERRQRSFGGIGFSGLERDVVDFTGRGAPTFAGAVPFTNDGCTVGVHGDPDPGDVDRKEAAAVFTREHAAGLDGLPIPAIKPEDPIGLRDRIPALDIGELAAIGLARADVAADRGCAAALAPVLLRSPSSCPHAQDRFWIGEGNALDVGARL